MPDLLKRLLVSEGIYWGKGDGPESGEFVGRIEVRPGEVGVVLTYEAWSHRDGMQHLERAVLRVQGGRLQLRTEVSEMDVPLIFQEHSDGEFRLVADRDMRIVIAMPEDEALTYAWWWAPPGKTAIEQSKVTAKKTHA